MRKLNRLFWSFQIENCTFSVEFWVGAPLKNCLNVVRLAMYVGIFQFYCTWKIENCRIFRPKLVICLQNSEVSCSCVIGWKNSMWPRAHMISEVFWSCFGKVYRRLVSSAMVFQLGVFGSLLTRYAETNIYKMCPRLACCVVFHAYLSSHRDCSSCS